MGSRIGSRASKTKTKFAHLVIASFLKLLTLSGLLFLSPVFASPRVKVLKLAITNPSNETREVEDVVVSVAELKRIAPDFKAGEAIVTTSDEIGRASCRERV